MKKGEILRNLGAGYETYFPIIMNAEELDE